MENIWVSIPLDTFPEYFPHGSEVIIRGEIVRDSDADLLEGLQPYIRADQVLLYDEEAEVYILIEASGES